MTLDPRIERALPTVLADLGKGQPDYADNILRRTAQIRQRPAWVFPERWLPVGIATTRATLPQVRWRLIAVALVVVALVAVAIAVGAGSQRRLPSPFGSARNGAIAYMTGGDIYAADPAGGAPRAIAIGPSYDFRPGFSPDGTKIGFLRRVDPAVAGRSRLVVTEADGTDTRVLTQTPLLEEPPTWTWTPDSASLIVITSDRPDSEYQVFDAHRPGPPRIIGLGGLTTNSTPVFQPPTGNRVLIRGQLGSTIGLYTMNADGSDLTPLFVHDDNESALDDLRGSVWSPDGRQIVYMNTPAGTDVTHLYLMNADGSGARILGAPTAGQADGWPKFSPDGKRILFVRFEGDPLTYTWAVVSLADDTVVSLGHRISSDVASGAAWSPDGTRILSIVPTANGGDAFLLDPDTGATTDVTWNGDSADWQRVAQ